MNISPEQTRSKHPLLRIPWQKLYAWVPLLIIVITFLAISNINLSKDYRSGSMEADGKGYYAYLPAIFIYNDLSFGFFYQVERETYYNPDFYYTYLRQHQGKVINKYYAGTALCMMPFFFLGHLATLASGHAADGYSYYYMLFVHLGALFYLFLGLIALRKLLRTFMIKEQWIALTLPAIVFGTNLFYYVLTEYSMSHVYSFAIVSLFLLCTRKYFTSLRASWLVPMAMLLGLIVLIRPVNLLIILAVPFLAGSRDSLMTGLRMLLKSPRILAFSITGFTGIAAIQPLIYYFQTGSFFVYSYPGEGFNFLQPQIVNMLFSYRKGLFLYTPLLLISLLGLLPLWKQNRFQAVAWILFFLLLTYILSSWHMWYYGGSFSQRVFIDFYALFAILLALAFQNLPAGKLRSLFIGTAFFLTLFCQYQTYQYRHMVIHWSDMNREKYWDGLFRLNP